MCERFSERRQFLQGLVGMGLTALAHGRAWADPGSRNPAALAQEPLPLTPLLPHVYVLYGYIAQVNTVNRGFNGNAAFIVTSEGVVVLDSLGTPLLGRRLVGTIGSVTKQPIRYLILTHHHPDHAYGAVALKKVGARIVAHPDILDYEGSEQMMESVTFRERILPEDMRGYRFVRPDVEVRDVTVLTVGGVRFEVINAGRHHSRGDLMLYLPREKILFTADLVFNGRTTFLGDGNTDEILTWIDRVRRMDAAVMVPGHGEAQAPPFPMVEQTRSYVVRLKRLMRKLADDLVEIPEALGQASRAFPDWERVPLFWENHRRNALHVYLEEQQKQR